MSYASLIAGFEIVVGYVSEHTAKIGLISLRGGTVEASCDGGNVSVPTLVDVGEHPSNAGQYACAAGTLTIEGLGAFKTYHGTVTCDGISRDFSFTTLPSNAYTDYKFWVKTCERQYGQRLMQDIWPSLRARAEAAVPPLLFRVHVDDLHYVDRATPVNDTATGIAQTGNPELTGEAWDYAVGWCAWYGLFPSYNTTIQSADRFWVMRNIPLWAQWGDHEVANNWGDFVGDDAGGERFKNHVEDAALYATAKAAYKAFIADHCTPPRQSEDGGPATQADAMYWGTSVGPIRFVAFDRNGYVQQHDAADSGDTHHYRRQNARGDGSASGATNVTRSDYGVDYDVQPPHMMGQTQVDDMLAFLDADEPFKLLLTATPICTINEPWADLWPMEFDDFISRKGPIQFVTNPRFIDGVDGWTLSGATESLALSSGVQSLRLENTAAAACYITQQISGLVVGQTYTVSVTSSNGQYRYKVGNSADNGALINNLVTAIGTFSDTFVATNTSHWVTITNRDTTSGDAFNIKEVSVTGSVGTGRAAGLLQNDKTNGVIGTSVWINGDCHMPIVQRYSADGTVDGLGSTWQASGSLWAICTATLNSSGLHQLKTWTDSFAAGDSRCNAEIRYAFRSIYNGESNPLSQIGSLLEVTVNAADPPQSLTFELLRVPTFQRQWRGIQTAGQGDNDVHYPTRELQIA